MVTTVPAVESITITDETHLEVERVETVYTRESLKQGYYVLYVKLHFVGDHIRVLVFEVKNEITSHTLLYNSGNNDFCLKPKDTEGFIYCW
jgi:hypothetical protein